MRDYLTLGPTPTGEDCEQVPYENPAKAKKECRVFKEQLIRQFGEPPFGADLVVKSFPHDFGSYHEVVAYFDDQIPESVEYAFKLEGQTPEEWDEQAKNDLR